MDLHPNEGVMEGLTKKENYDRESGTSSTESIDIRGKESVDSIKDESKILNNDVQQQESSCTKASKSNSSEGAFEDNNLSIPVENREVVTKTSLINVNVIPDPGVVTSITHSNTNDKSMQIGYSNTSKNTSSCDSNNLVSYKEEVDVSEPNDNNTENVVRSNGYGVFNNLQPLSDAHDSKYMKNTTNKEGNCSGTSQDSEENKVYQRFLFNTRRQELGETLQAFSASLKILSGTCNYDADEVLIDSLIRDRFIAGIRETSIQLELLKPSCHRPLYETNGSDGFIKALDYDFSLQDATQIACAVERNVRVPIALKSEEALGSDDAEYRTNFIEPQTLKIEPRNTINATKSSDTMMGNNSINDEDGTSISVISTQKNNFIGDVNNAEHNIIRKPLVRLKRCKSDKRLNGRKKGTQTYNCSYCTDYFSNKKILGKHMKEKHAGEERVSCNKCEKVFEDKDKLEKHSDTAHKGKGILCKLCSNSYKSQACLKAHVRGKHETGGEKVCLICFQVLEDDKELKEHTVELHNDGGMTCSICNKQLRMDESLRSHIKKKHSEDGKTICPYCGKMFALIEQHIAKDHSTDEWRKCDQCDFTGSKHMIQCHMYYYHPKGPELICDTCGYRTPHNSVLKQHIRMVHQKIKPYSCGKCHRSFFSESRLKDHDIVFHKNQMFSCEICHKSYKIRRQLQVHIRSVHQGIWVHCPQCNLKFAENHDLKRHKKHVHDRNYTFNCDECGRGFPFSTRLKEHMQKHHNVIM